jgi:hypothetical protein
LIADTARANLGNSILDTILSLRKNMMASLNKNVPPYTPKNSKYGKDQTCDKNEDPLSGEPGAHPLGTGIGATAGGAVTGMAIGSAGGPVGAAVGIVAGAVAGGLLGKAAAEELDPTTCETADEGLLAEHNRSLSSSYVNPTAAEEAQYQQFVARHYDPLMSFDDREVVMRSDWEGDGYGSRISWGAAREKLLRIWSDMPERLGENYSQIPPDDVRNKFPR